MARRRYYGNQGVEYDPNEALSYGGMFYDPNSPGLNIGMGVRNVFQNLIATRQKMQQMEAERKQQEFENSLAERKVAVDEAESKARAAKGPTIPEWMQKAQVLVDTGIAPDLPSAIKETLNYETPEDKSKRIRSETAAREEASAPFKAQERALAEAASDKKVKAALAVDKIKGIQTRLWSQMAAKKKEAAQTGVEDPVVKNLDVLRRFIDRRMNKLVKGTFSDQDMDMLDKISAALETGDLMMVSPEALPQENAAPTAQGRTAYNPQTGQTAYWDGIQWTIR